MKIYTRKGDKGKTQLLGGSIVSKNHIKLDCYGTIDELNSFIGNIHDENISPKHKKSLITIQNQLFNLGSLVAYDGKKNNLSLPDIKESDIDMIEVTIDEMEASLPMLKNFILPSGFSAVSKCHIARTVCRRAERNLVKLEEIENINPIHIKYLNRLSDYLFVLARFILMENNIAEVEWQKK